MTEAALRGEVTGLDFPFLTDKEPLVRALSRLRTASRALVLAECAPRWRPEIELALARVLQDDAAVAVTGPDQPDWEAFLGGAATSEALWVVRGVEGPAFSRGLDGLNVARDTVLHDHARLWVWLPPGTLALVAQRAPDLWRYRTVTLSLVPTPSAEATSPIPPPAEGLPMSPHALFELLRPLQEADLERLIGAMAATELVPGPRAEPAARKMALANLAIQKGRVEALLGHLYRISPRQADPAAWLHTLGERFRYLQVLGLHDEDGDHEYTLDQLYVELELEWAADHTRGSPGRERLGAKAGCADGPFSLDGALRAARGLAQSRRCRGVVIVGLPGSGKTTMLRRRFVTDLDAAAEAGTPTRTLLLRCSSTRGLDLAKLAPGELFPAWTDQEGRLDGHPTAGRALLADRRAPWTFLLDGWDELASPDQRRALAVALKAELVQWPAAEVVLATRYAVWRGSEEHTGDHKALDKLLLPFDLLGLSEPAIDALARRWFAAAGAEGRERARGNVDRLQRLQGEEEALVAGLLHAIRHSEERTRLRLWELARNPLLLTLLCMVYRKEREARRRLPRRRGELYSRCFDILARRHGDQPGHIEPDDLRLLLRPLAWALQGAGEAGEAGRELPRGLAEGLIGEAALQHEALSRRSAAELLEHSLHHSGILVCPDGVQVGFIHQTFQEQLAAESALVEEREAELAARAGEPRWREPILLGMAHPGFHRRFWKEVLASPGRASELAELLSACAAEEEPPLALINDALRRANPADLRVLLALLRGREGSAERYKRLMPGLEGLVEHEDEAISHLAAELLGVEAPQPRGVDRVRRARVKALSMDFVWVPAGTFLMGATRSKGQPGFDKDANDDESPPHPVTISEGFWLGRFPVTNVQLQGFVAAGGRAAGSIRKEGFNHPEQPATELSWDDAVAWCAWASKKVGMPIDLPTEAEWEWAARGPEGRRYPWGEAPPSASLACYGAGDGKAPKAPPKVGERPGGAGPFGAEEQAGTVWEWCRSRYGPYLPGAHRDPGMDALSDVDEGVSPSEWDWREDDRRAPRVVRGGSWVNHAGRLRAACRGRRQPWVRGDHIGFRVVVRSPELVGR